MAKKKYQPPAKTKYDNSHPIISIRLTPDLKKKLEDIKKISDKSVADVLKEAVRLQTPSMRKAYTKGYREAKTKYAVTYNCSVCGKVITMSTQGERKAGAQYMKENRWAHGECLKK